MRSKRRWCAHNVSKVDIWPNWEGIAPVSWLRPRFLSRVSIGTTLTLLASWQRTKLEVSAGSQAQAESSLPTDCCSTPLPRNTFSGANEAQMQCIIQNRKRRNLLQKVWNRAIDLIVGQSPAELCSEESFDRQSFVSANTHKCVSDDIALKKAGIRPIN